MAKRVQTTHRRRFLSRPIAQSGQGGSVGLFTGHARLVWAAAAAIVMVSPDVTAAQSVSRPPTPLPDIRDPCVGFTSSAKYISQSIIMDLEGGTVSLRVPEPYFEDYWDRQQGFTDTAQLFRVEIGTFQPVSRAETGRRNKEGIWNWMTFLIGDVVPLERIAVLSAESWSSVLGGDQNRRLDSYVLLPAPFGLLEIRSNAPQPTQGFRRNTYIDQSADGTLSAVFSCRAVGSVLSPGCQHWFRAARMDVELFYRRTELPNWRALQADVTAFLTCATQENP